jgi:hypothetical protein
MLVSKVFSIESDHVRRAADKARLLTASDWRRSCHYQMVTDDELLLWVCCPELPCLLPWCIARDSNQNARLKIENRLTQIKNLEVSQEWRPTELDRVLTSACA